MSRILLYFFMVLSFSAEAQYNAIKSAGVNGGGLGEMYDLNTTIELLGFHHQLQVGIEWKPVSSKLAYHSDFIYLVFPVQYQYHYYINRKYNVDVNVGLQFQYTLSTTLPDQLKITPAAGISYTRNLEANCYYIRGGVLCFIPLFTSADKYETFMYTGQHWLFWPQLGIGKYLH